ncbi:MULTISPECIES: hypothetical protein [Pantoea]|jgi:TRAP-type C4-dicarboxylate transport system permease large subunit|uniref:Uncharacterized protein n=1 Tax=Candidatus Pantoea communis TaxID=2608354 RepID=A0ABX0RRM9_9GAMM|nr:MULTISPECIES: hypothetical protein [Pantoea]MXP55115.1 hypothetical protein [Pantoea sp. Seng]MXP57737.1 hypothetical protein [Pantoea sp. Taur]NIG20270.1 hypothetical protein [Pantoea communis]SNY73935.1 hypothetical protein SAMN02744778_03665 [Pantoea sp. GL120224-02]
MRITIDSADQPFIHRLLGEEIGQVDTQSSDTRLQHALDIARQQKNHEAELDWKRNAVFLALFIFLYAVLGASLTLDLTAQAPSHKSLVYALEAVPVLIAFSGLFVSLLFLFFTRSSARRLRSWDQGIFVLEKYVGTNLYKQINEMGARTTNYSQSAINVALALFICVTWVVMYNYFTFTTSGVIGSVISLFITTMTYVILDIQLLKSGTSIAIDEPLIPADEDKEKK